MRDAGRGLCSAAGTGTASVRRADAWADAQARVHVGRLCRSLAVYRAAGSSDGGHASCARVRRRASWSAVAWSVECVSRTAAALHERTRRGCRRQRGEWRGEYRERISQCSIRRSRSTRRSNRNARQSSRSRSSRTLSVVHRTHLPRGMSTQHPAAVWSNRRRIPLHSL